MEEQNNAPVIGGNGMSRQTSPISWFINKTWQVLAHNVGALLGLIIVPQFIVIVPFSIVAAIFIIPILNVSTSQSAGTISSSSILVFSIFMLAVTGVEFYVYARIFAGLVPAILDYINNDVKIGFSKTWSLGKGKSFTVIKTYFAIVWPLIVIQFLPLVWLLATVVPHLSATDGLVVPLYLRIIMAVTMIVSLVVGFLIFLYWGVAVQAAVYENLSPGLAKRRSVVLTNGKHKTMLFVYLIMFAVAIPLALISPIPIIGTIAAIIINIISLIWPIVLYALLLERASQQQTQQPQQAQVQVAPQLQQPMPSQPQPRPQIQQAPQQGAQLQDSQAQQQEIKG